MTYRTRNSGVICMNKCKIRRTQSHEWLSLCVRFVTRAPNFSQA